MTAEEIEALLTSVLPSQATGVYPWRCEDETPAEVVGVRPTVRITLRNGKVFDGIVTGVGDHRRDKSHIAVWIESGALRFCYPVEFSLDPNNFSATDIVSACIGATP